MITKTSQKIKLYSTPTCVYCKMAREFFKSHHIDFKEVDVAVDAKERDEMIQKSGQLGVPVIEIDENLVIGFDKPKIVELLGI